MKIRMALAALLVAGMFGVTATTVDAQCKQKEKAKSGCKASQAKAGCQAAQAKHVCSDECKKSGCQHAHAKHQCSADCKKSGCKHAHAKHQCSADCKKSGCQHAHAKHQCSADCKKSGCQHAHAKHQCSAECKKSGCKAAHAKQQCSAECKKSCSAEKTCKYTASECSMKIRKHYQTRGWLGIEMNLEGSQPTVTRVTNGSPAEAAGFQVGDVLTSLNGIPYGQGNDAVLAEMNKNGFEVGDTVTYTVNRDGHIELIQATLGRISEPGLARMIEFHMQNAQHKH